MHINYNFTLKNRSETTGQFHIFSPDNFSVEVFFSVLSPGEEDDNEYLFERRIQCRYVILLSLSSPSRYLHKKVPSTKGVTTDL
jgi:hypothetical protein